MLETPTPVEIFCSYAHEDEAWRDKLERHVSPLKDQGLISLWHDRLIIPGTDWAKTIDTHLEASSIILLLVSVDFFASDYCIGIEMKRALERQEANEALVIPILIRPVIWHDAPFAHLHALPLDAKPLSTWENEEIALTMVAAGIRRAVEELPLLTASAPRAALPAIWNIPYSRNPFFLGRDDELARLRSHLQAGQVTALSQSQAISGLGGIGKTQLALEYAYRYHQEYQAVLWARAESIDELISSYVAIAKLLRLPSQEAKEQQITVQAVKTWLQTHRGWLLILDNADEMAVLPDFLPPDLGGHLLLTTRAAATGQLAHRLEIETLSPEQGALFLLRRSGLIATDAILKQAVPQEQKLAVQISQELGGLPLALDQAGAYLEETRADLTKYWQIYQQHRAELLQRRGRLAVDYPASVATTWSLSFQQVQAKHPATAELLRMCAFLSPDAIPEEIFEQGVAFLGPILAPVARDAFLLDQVIEALLAYSLVRRNPKEKTLSIHRLVQAVIQDTLQEEERRYWVEQSMLAVNVAFPDVEHKTWLQCERFMTQALFASQWIEQYQLTHQEAGRLLYETASYLQDRARYTEAEPLYQRALHIRENQLGPEHPQVAITLNGLADLYRKQGKYTEAEPLFQRALHIWEQQLGPEPLEVSYPLNYLGRLYYEQGKYTEAEPLYQRALHIRENQLGPEHPQVAIALNGLAELYRKQGKYEQAESLFQRALHIWEQQLGPEHPEVSSPLNNLAAVYYEQGKYTEAEPLFQRALHIWEQQLGPEHPHVAIALNNLAWLYREQGKYTEAESLYQRALHIWEQQLGPEHYQVAYPLNNLAELYCEQGKYTEAEPLFQRALSIFEQRLGPEHSQVAYPLNGLAKLYHKQGKYTKAEPLFQRAISIREQQLGSDHPQVAFPINNLALLYTEQGKYTEAEPLYQRALSIRKQALGSQHPETAETMHDLAQFWEMQGNHEVARSLYIQTLLIRGQALGAHHPKTTETRTRLIVLLHTQGQHEQAAQLERDQSES